MPARTGWLQAAASPARFHSNQSTNLAGSKARRTLPLRSVQSALIPEGDFMHDHPARAAGAFAPGTQLHSRSLIAAAVAFALACAAGGVPSAFAAPAPEPQAQTTGASEAAS